MTFDPATEAYMQRLLDEAPALTDEQAAWVARDFADDATADEPQAA